MAKYQRIKGGEKNERTGVPFSRIELEKVYDLYIEINGKGIHENNPKIHRLAKDLGRTVRSVENQLLGFRIVDTGTTGRANYNRLIKDIWDDKRKATESSIPVKFSDKKEDTQYDFKFKISSQLKNIIGKELITDDYIAIFELVKNSYDAHAKKVKVIFEEDKIIIQDDGKGMDIDDIHNKWLFVAYSAKKEGIEDKEFEDKTDNSYRDKLIPKRSFAGAKGIGRFSADRLGARLNLITRKITETSPYWNLTFNWDDFEQDAEDEFVNIEVDHSSSENTSYENFDHGLILEITNLRSIWPREKLLNLKWSLEKLINPFSNLDNQDNDKTFQIEIISEEQKPLDNQIKKQNDFSLRDLVNGLVSNFIFETLNIKTTQIQTGVEDNKIITTLYDRGNLIYKIEEENPYYYVPESSRIQLFYLNRSAKNNFTRLMGIEAVNFGSVFLFNNGFRVFPMGEPGDDPFGIDKRKAQGHARFLGTRELIGSIEVWGQSEHFQETSSRDGGLIETPGTQQLFDFFLDTLKKLEKYVQPILWQIKKRTGNENEEIDLNAKADIIDFVANLAGNKTIKLLEYSKEFLNILENKTTDTPPEVFSNLKKIATELNDETFINEIDESELEYVRIKREKEEEIRKRLEAERLAQEEREKRLLAEKKLKEEGDKRKEEEYKRLKAEEEAREERAKRTAEEQRRRQRESQVRFLESISSLDVEDVLNLNHQIGIDSNAIEQHIVNFKRKLDNGKVISNDDIQLFLDKITFANKKILAVTKFSTRQNFMAAARIIEDDLISFLKNYLLNIYKFHLGKDLDLKVVDEINNPFRISFKPIEITIIVDNLISNSKRKNAKSVIFTFRLNSEKDLEVCYTDDGDGLDKELENSELIFEKGITTTRGSGLGLFHVRKIMNELKGSVTLDKAYQPENTGIQFILTFPK
ncbi:ATP-binding protein [Pedobacter montanisoli]|uniref:ATP-binding protein n=1 Tax=Pedobacter montanisoli TaxID=2923277 RepID=A0ABS9ZTK4_9SPHI|nr:ATP-binding protein [Pedobacter montanisoli]MCJ0741843.1 ATP-binding protein [Pedobacter montanisoli]